MVKVVRNGGIRVVGIAKYVMVVQMIWVGKLVGMGGGGKSGWDGWIG